MKNFILIILISPSFFSSCHKDEKLPDTELVMIKFVNKTGDNIENLTISRAAIGTLKKGKSTSEYIQYDSLGEQYGYALVEAVGDINGKKHFTSSACNGVCGTASAPDGNWLEPGYYKVAIRIANEAGYYLEFKMQ